MQLAALDTSLACLVLTGSRQPPIYNVMHRATSRGVPVITTDTGTSEIMAGLEAALLGTRLNQPEKLSGLGEMIKQNLDMNALTRSG
jgi:BioD-like phosphotransacetylase family protein